MVFEEGVDRVQRSSRSAARQDQVVADRLDDNAFGSESVRGELRIGPFGRVRPDENARARLDDVGYRHKAGACDLFQEVRQFLSGVPFRFGRILGNHNEGARPSVLRDRDRRKVQ